MAKSFIYKNNLTKEIILTIAKAGVLAIAATSPYFLHNLVRAYFRNKSHETEKQISRRLKELEKRRVLDIREMPDHTVRVTITKSGQKAIRQYNLESMKIVKPKQWDGQWRIIIYDIPNSRKKAANAFREKIKNLGLYQLQRSVWVYPYDCIKEIEFLCDIFEININHHLFYFKTKEIPKEKEIKTFFSI